MSRTSSTTVLEAMDERVVEFQVESGLPFSVVSAHSAKHGLGHLVISESDGPVVRLRGHQHQNVQEFAY